MPDKSTDIKDKVALITGASRRIGAEIARALHRTGMKVCIHYRSSIEPAQKLIEEFESTRPGSASLVQMDLLQTGELPALIQQVTRQWGRLDLLVNNASTFYPTAVGEIDEADWHDLLGSNLKAPLFLSQAAAAELSARQGSIINIVDIHAQRPKAGYLVYNIAKSGLMAMTRSLAVELAPEVRVNGIAPGAIMWPEDEAEGSPQHEEILRKTALGRSGEPQDIARAAVFLTRDAPYVTGHILPVDGGRLLTI